MRPGQGIRRFACLVLIAVTGLLPAAGVAIAQDLGRVVSPILTVDQDRLFSETAYGTRIRAILDQESRALAAETREIEAALEAEELDLTERRATLEVAEFRALADAFDEKVQTLRAEREARQQAFVRRLDAEQVAFLERAGPVLAGLVRELGGIVILDRRVILLTIANIDVTDLAIARIDAELGDGAMPGDAPAPEGGSE